MADRQDESGGQAQPGISRRDLLRSGVAGAVGLAAGGEHWLELGRGTKSRRSAEPAEPTTKDSREPTVT